LKRISKEGVLGRWDGHNETAKRGLVMPGTAGKAGRLRRWGGGKVFDDKRRSTKLFVATNRNKERLIKRGDETFLNILGGLWIKSSIT